MSAEATEVLPAVHGRREVTADPRHEVELAASLRETLGRDRLVDLYARFDAGAGPFDAMMRRVIWRALARQMGDALSVGANVCFKHIETFEIGSGVFIGRNTILSCKNGDIRIEDGANIGFNCEIFSASEVTVGRHTLVAAYAYLVGGDHEAADRSAGVLEQGRVSQGISVGAGAWIGAGATILDGVTIGDRAIIGASAVVRYDVPEAATAVGVPARILDVTTGSQG